MRNREPRTRISNEFLKGDGIEVGALHNPLVVHPGRCRVRYLDRMPVSELRRQYPELQSLPLVHIDIVDDGETLSTVAPASVDFVIGNHFLEHCEDPIGTLRSFLSRVKVGGRLFLSVPDRRYTFDIDRPPTPWEHMLADHQNGPAASRRGHFEEWVGLVSKITSEPERTNEVNRIMDMKYSIHFHVWEETTLRSFLESARGVIPIPFKVVKFEPNPDGKENIAILERTGT